MQRNRRYGFGRPRPTGYETLVVPASSAVGFQSIPVDTSNAIIHITGDAIRWRCREAPTATEGIRLETDSFWEMMETNLDWADVLPTMLFISLGSGSVLEVQWFG